MSDYLEKMLDVSNLRLIRSKNTLLKQGILTAFFCGRSDYADLFIEFAHILKVVTNNYNEFIKFTKNVNKKLEKLSNLQDTENDDKKKCEINQILVNLTINYPIQIRIYLRTIFIELRTLYYLRKQIEHYFHNKSIKKQIMSYESDILNIRDSLIHIDQCLIKGKSFRKIRHENGSIFYYSLKYDQEASFNLSKVKEIIDLYNNLLQPNNKKQ